jgi:hypothetical protein
MNDYVFRGVTQSNHKPSVAAYFEPRYNVTKDLQLYVGLSGESISFSNRPAAEIDIYGGIRPTFGAFAFDIGVWGYLYPGGTCQYGTGLAPGVDFAGHFQGAECATNFLANGNVMKKDVSFFEAYGKVNYTINDNWQFGLNEYYSPNFLNSGAWGNYSSITGKYIAPSTIFGSSGVGMYVSGEFGRQWFGTTDSFYGVRRSRTASIMLTTTPGTSASALPTRCSRWTCVIPTPICRRVIAAPSRVLSTLPERPTSPRLIRSGQVRIGAARPASSSSRLT